MRRVVFVERDRGALLYLRKNIAVLGVTERSMVLPIDAYRLISHVALTNDGAEPISLAFIDPPYAHTEPGAEYARLKRMLTELAAKGACPERTDQHPTPSRCGHQSTHSPWSPHRAGTYLRFDEDNLADGGIVVVIHPATGRCHPLGK